MSSDAAIPNHPLDPRRQWISEIFGIDIRALAAFRVGIALVLLADLATRARHLVAHYSDDGVLPRSAWTMFCNTADNQGAIYWWSLHRLSGESWWEILLFCVAALFAVLLLMGYRTRLATIASWILLASLQSRNPLNDSGGDTLLRCALFWAMFLPLGAAASVDRQLRSAKDSCPQRVFSTASVALLLQVAMTYLFSAAFKSRGTCWTTDHSAVYYALSLETFSTPLGRRLLAWPGLLRFFTAATYWLEWLGPLIAFAPVWRAPLRLISVLAFWGFHLGLVFTLYLGIFPWVMMVAWIPFVPTAAWDFLARLVQGRWREVIARCAANIFIIFATHRWMRWPAAPYWRLGPVQSTVVALLLAYVLAWNTWDLLADYLQPLPSLDIVGHVTRLNQRWGMFSPCPGRYDGWYIMRGVLHDGTEVNLWRPGEPLLWDKPQDIFDTYGDERDRQHLAILWDRRYGLLRQFLADWLRWRWNREQAGDDPRRRVAEVELIYMLEFTPPPGGPLPKPEPVSLGFARYD